MNNEHYARILSLGRGKNSVYGNIAYIDPIYYTYSQLVAISFGEGTNKTFGAISLLDPGRFNAEQMGYMI